MPLRRPDQRLRTSRVQPRLDWGMGCPWGHHGYWRWGSPLAAPTQPGVGYGAIWVPFHVYPTRWGPTTNKLRPRCSMGVIPSLATPRESCTGSFAGSRVDILHGMNEDPVARGTGLPSCPLLTFLPRFTARLSAPLTSAKRLLLKHGVCVSTRGQLAA